jgi:hypothetical protein
MAMSVVGLSKSAGTRRDGEGGSGSEKRVAPQNRLSGRHAGHVLRVEKGSRAVKGLQRHSAGCTARKGTESRAVHTWE